MILTYNRIAIVGYPRVGKTFVSGMVDDRTVFHADDYIGREEFLSRELKGREHFAVEGVGVFKMLRSGLDVDLVLYVKPKFQPWPKHDAQRKALDTIWQQYLRKSNGTKIMKLNEDSVSLFFGH